MVIVVVAMVIACMICAISAAPYDMPTKAQFEQYMKIFNENLEWSGTDAIVAARSKENPNYFYDWVRDSALAIRTMESLYGTNTTEISKWYERYENSVTGQLTKNEHGVDGVDIRGEVKYYVDGSLFTGPWCRSQNDGASARMLIRLNYAFYKIQMGQVNKVRDEMWRADGSRPGLKWELDYIKAVWKDHSCDAWEEARGLHYYTLAVHRKALVHGARLAYQLGFDDYAIQTLQVAQDVADVIRERFVKDGKILPMIDVDSSPSDRLGYDTAVTLGLIVGDFTTPERAAPIITDLNQSLRAHFKRAGCSTAAVLNKKLKQPNADCAQLSYFITTTASIENLNYLAFPTTKDNVALNSLYGLMQWSKDNFVVNKALLEKGYVAGLVARYPNDVYDGTGVSRGNPWILSNFIFAEALLVVGNSFINSNVINFDNNALPLVKDIWTTVQNKRPQDCTTERLQTLITNANQGKSYQDTTTAKCIQVGAYYYSLHTANVVFEQIGFPLDLSEQIHRDTGIMRGASYLTWSYSTYHSWYTQLQKVNFDF
eukprot:UN02046